MVSDKTHSDEDINVHRLTQIRLSLGFTVVYTMLYTAYYIHTLKKYWKQMLGPTQIVMITFESLFVIDFINNMVQLILVENGVVT